MNVIPELAAEEPAKAIELEDYRKRGSARASRRRVRVMVEVACDTPIGEEIKIGLARHIEGSSSIVISDRRPDWVFSIIAFDHGYLVELSVILRQFFRSTVPGTETAVRDSSGEAVRREGGWVYESLRYHGLHGVPRSNLRDFLKGLAEGFVVQHLGLPQDAKKQPQCNG